MAAVAEDIYIGVDVGGTKIQASCITGSGTVLASCRTETPRNCSTEVTLQTIDETIRSLLAEQNRTPFELAGIGIAVPGVVQQETGRVIVTPNMNLSDVDLGQHMRQRFNGLPVAVGNDCNLGTLGECWLGSGRNAASCVGIFIGTGIGAGIVINNTVLSGAGQTAGEIGHIVIQIPCGDWRHFLKHKKHDGNPAAKSMPRCGCGNYGCFESLASRTAIERDIRETLESGEKSCLKISGNVIKSGSLAKALKAEDKIVTTIMRYASQVIGYVCLTVRHLLDPEVIVLGGGVMEACQNFMMPVIEEIMSNDQLPAAPGKRQVLVSSLGDNAVVLGAVALVRSAAGNNPLQKKSAKAVPRYPTLRMMAENVIHITDKPYSGDFYLLSNGTVEPREKLPKKNEDGFRLKDIEKASQGGIDMLILITPGAGETLLPAKCRDYLHRRGIDYRILPLDEGVKLYNQSHNRRAAVVHF
ncbi:MAG: ROK family protein [Planctomycetaceae bacterium]|jgi:glucokinase|nr:ROK family protein [Planctomycetaceae bacterium]